jgi:hypothetical protein
MSASSVQHVSSQLSVEIDSINDGSRNDDAHPSHMWPIFPRIMANPLRHRSLPQLEWNAT